MKIEQITSAHAWNEQEILAVNNLLQQLTAKPKAIDAGYLARVATTGVLLVIRDGEQIIGLGLLALVIAPAHQSGRIEDVVVDENYRGQGLGRKITEELIAKARELGLGRIDLTSHPLRQAANSLYQKLGWELVGTGQTNFYSLKL